MPFPQLISRYFLPRALQLLYATLRISVVEAEKSLPTERCIVAFWHGKMVVGWLFAQKLFPHNPHKTMSAVVSLSTDGKILSDALEQLGFLLIRGSSSKGGNEVKAKLFNNLQRGNIVAITPDGPRGPHHQFKYGTIRLASQHNIPIVFADIRCHRCWQLKSWDKFEIPKPFSSVTISLHHIELPQFSSESDLQAYSQTLSLRFSHEY